MTRHGRSPAARLRRHLAGAAAAMLCLAGPAAAETAPVRSGDHPDRARLVIELARPTDWRLGRVEGGYAIEFARPDVEFDLGQVFRLITRDRVAAVEAATDAPRLTIRTGCDCHASAMDFNERWVVVDIVDGPAPADSPFETAFAPAMNAAPAPEASADEARAAQAGILPRLLPGLGTAGPGTFLPARATEAAPPQPAPVTVIAAPQNPAAEDVGSPLPELPALGGDWQNWAARPPVGPAFGGIAVPAPSAAADLAADQAAERIATQETALLEELARAAAQGLLQAHLPALDRLEERQADTAEPAPPDPPPPETAGPEDHMRLRAETSIDRDAGASSPRRGVTDEGTVCLSDDAVDLAGWGGSGDPGEGIATHRAKLVGEFDQPDPEAVLAMARFYLHLGFGAEARATLTAFDADLPGADVLRAMAAVVDGGREGLPGPLAGQESCDGAVALWSLLAEAGPDRDHAPNVRAVVAAFSGLPLPLRRSLGPDLAARFLALGDEDTALRLRNAIARAAGDPGGGLELLDARLALAEGDPRAPEALAALVGSDDATAAEAYRTYLETELAAGRVPPDGAETAAALAFERAGTAEGAALAELAVRSLIAAGDFDVARAEIARLDGETPGAAAKLWPIFAESILRGAPDGVFLAQLFAAREELKAADLSPDTGRALAARLTGLGFGDEALHFVPDEADPATRLVRAEALLVDLAPDAALAELAGLEGAEADRLMGRALVALGDPAAAAARYAAAGQAADAERAAFIAGAWEQLAESEDQTLRQLARDRLAQENALVGQPPTASPDAPAAAGTGRVSAARGALASAESARATVEHLLTRP